MNSNKDNILSMMTQILKERLGNRMDEFAIPPPVLSMMEGEFLEFDPDKSVLSARFPVLEEYLNPYGSMQGGMIAAAVDNTLGPLSMLVAPPNVTRTLEMKYSLPITLDMDSIIVTAKLLERKPPRLFFEADVRNLQGQRLARCKAVHWIIEGISL